MPPLLLDLLLLLSGFALLTRGADGLVDGGATLARRLGVSHMLIGLTIVSWGTSMPEIVVAGLAARRGEFDESLGTVLGSNVANIGLVLGTCAWILPLILSGRVQGREAFWLLGSLCMLGGVLWDGLVTRAEGGALLIAFLVYNLMLLREAQNALDTDQEHEETHETRHPWLAVLLGSVAIAIGAEFVMRGAGGLAERAGLADGVVGLTIFALGTSLPELTAGVRSAMKGHADISFGNVIGSNVFNTLAVVGVATLARNVSAPSAAVSALLTRDLSIALGFSVGLVLLPFVARDRLRRQKATVLLLGYLTFVVAVILR